MRRLMPVLLFAACQPALDVPGLTGERPAAPELAVEPRHSYQLTFTVSGSAEPGTRVRLFANGACDGVALREVSPEELAAGVTVGAVPASDNLVTARAVSPPGLASDCSGSVTFQQRLPRTGSLGLATRPHGPSQELRPSLVGRAPAGSRVRVFSGPGCDAPPLLEVTPAQLERGVPLAAARDRVSWWSAQAFDDGGEASTCGSVSYEHDDRPPWPPVLLWAPITPSSDPAIVLGLSVEADACIELFARPDCLPPAESFSGCGQPSATTLWYAGTPELDGETRYSARARDVAGNASPCVELFDYRHDSSLPPWLADVTAWRDTSGTIDVTGHTQTNAHVAGYDGARCEGTPFATSGGSSFVLHELGVDPSVDHDLSVRAWTPGGASSGCWALVVFAAPDAGP